MERSLGKFDEKAIREALFNFVVGCYHLVDWVKVYHPKLKPKVFSLLNQNKYLRACRDLCNASKHVNLDITRGSYEKYPPVLSDVEHSATGQTSPSGIAKFRVKLQFADGDRIPIEEFITKVMEEWKKFFNDKGIK